MTVHAGLGRKKARVITASGPMAGTVTYPQLVELSDIGIRVLAHGAAFGGNKLDHGTRFLLGFIDDMLPDARIAADIGCGTGILATVLAKSRRDLKVIAVDQSYAAVCSAAGTVAANGVSARVEVVRDDALDSVEESSVDLVVCNPPFHAGAAVHAGAGIKLLEGAARALRPGGELWTVFNSHLNYREQLRKLVGSTRVVGRNGRYTVTCSIRRG
jgi:16S rRNA (guanine1207-N2)-methyltransferase